MCKRKKLMINIKKVLTDVKSCTILHLTINIKKLFFVERKGEYYENRSNSKD